jgi:hypothetical protein
MRSTDRDRSRSVGAAGQPAEKRAPAEPALLCRYEELAIRENRAHAARVTKDDAGTPLADRAD